VPRSPTVSVLVAVRNEEQHLRAALESISRQTYADFELVVVDDASDDGTSDLLDACDDPRLKRVRLDAPLGVAGALNAGLDIAAGRYLARMDADDLALPDWLERVVGRIGRDPAVAIAGAGLVELDAWEADGDVHILPAGTGITRWRSLFGTPFFHNTIVLDRVLLDDQGLRYDPAYEGAEDYELWLRILFVADGDNIPFVAVRYRKHPAQASAQRAAGQLALRERIAVRAIAQYGLDEHDALRAWRIGDRRRSAGSVPPGLTPVSTAPFLELLDAFQARHGKDASVRAHAARSLAALASPTDPRPAARALRLDPALPLRVVADRARRRSALHDTAQTPSSSLSEVVRVAFVSPEPTPYRAPLLDRISDRDELELMVVYASDTVVGRTWVVTPRHHATMLAGRRIPGLRRVVRHDYPVTSGLGRALARARPDVVVVSGWSTFASQAAIVWCRRRGIPYILLVESHDAGPKAGWRRAVKGGIVPRLVRGAAGVLVVGSLARESMIAHGAEPAAIRVLANTIDVEAWSSRAERLRSTRDELRDELGLAGDDVAVLSVARLAPEKGLGTLVEAVARAGDERLVLLLAGDGLERAALARLAAKLPVRLLLLGDLAADRLAQAYVAADVFALLSTHEPWGVVVNEAAASGLPLLLSDRVGAAADLLVDGENGFLVPASDVRAAAVALTTLAGDPGLREALGARSRARVAAWGYEPSVEAFVEAVRAAAAR